MILTKNPFFSNASIQYSEHVGKNLQLFPNSGEMKNLYILTTDIVSIENILSIMHIYISSNLNFNSLTIFLNSVLYIFCLAKIAYL